MNVVGKDLYEARYLTLTDKRFEEIGIPRNLPIFDPASYHDEFREGNTARGQGNTLLSVWNFQDHLKRNVDRFTHSNSLSLHIARAVVEYKTACSIQDLGSQQDYAYLYSIEYRNWYHHFFRDNANGTILTLATASQFQSDTSFLCIDGGKVLDHICEENRPGEKTKIYTGLSLEALLPHIDRHVPLFLSGAYFQITEFLGEGFESVVFKVHNRLSGVIFALKLGKLALEENYRTLQPLLAVIKQSEISVPQYVSYDAHFNGILMEYSEGERFSRSIERMKQQKKTYIELFQIYATCLSKLMTLQSMFHLSHGDAHEENWLVKGAIPTLIDFRHSLTIPFTSQIYRYRDVFAMLCTLYQLVYGRHPANRREVKQAITQQRIYQTEHADAFPPFHHGNQYDPLLHQFLRRSVYNPQAFTLQDIAQVVNVYLSGFDLSIMK
jgi:hypothetical protein